MNWNIANVRGEANDNRLLFVTLADISGTSGQNFYSREIIKGIYNEWESNLTVICPKPDSDIFLMDKDIDFRYVEEKQTRDIGWNIRIQPPLLKGICSIVGSSNVIGIISTLKISNIIPPVISAAFDVPHISLAEGLLSENIKQIAPFRGAKRIADFVSLMNSVGSKQIFVPHQDAKSWLARFPFVSSGKILIQPHGVDLDRFDPVEKAEAKKQLNKLIPECSQMIGFLGSFRERHCLYELINAVRELNNADYDVGAVLIGEGPLRNELIEYADQLTISDKIYFPGFVSDADVSNFLSACDLLYGVRREDDWTNPMKIYEYLSLNRPVIAYNTPELRFVEQNKYGILVDNTDTDSIYNNIEQFFRSADMYASGSREYIRANCTWEQYGENIIQSIYDRPANSVH